MSEAVTGGAKPVLRQYFGASARHREACIEMSFPLPQRNVSPVGLAAALRRAGYDIDQPAFEKLRPLPEAIGVLASAILSKAQPPRWSWGTGDTAGWICMSYLSPLSAANAMLLCHKALTGGGEGAVQQLLRTAQIWVSPGKINGLVLGAAVEMGLDVVPISQGGLVFQLGACGQSRHLFELSNDGDGITGHLLAKDKLSTIDALRRAGLPTTDAVALWQAENASRAADQVGYPCVVKPRDAGKGKGVTAYINSPQRLAEAVERAAAVGSFPLVVENHVEGADHRMMVFRGKLLWAYRRSPPVVIGDGASTVRELIAAENDRRGKADPAQPDYLQPIAADLLTGFIGERYGLTLQSVLETGRKIQLAAEANVARGGILDDVTGEVHPDNRRLAVAAARLFRLTAMGIDFISPDISRSWREVPSAIIEVNGSPGISGRGDASLVLRTLFPGILSGRIPSFVVVGDDAYQRAATRLLSEALSGAKLNVAQCGYDSIPTLKNAEPFWHTRAPRIETLLLNRSVEAVIVTSAPGEIERLGFPLGSCDALVVQSPADMSAFMRHQADRVVSATLDAASVSRLVGEVVAAHRGNPPGGARPFIEVIPDEDGSAAIRCWRIRALPRSSFDPSFGAGMATQRDVVRATVRLARRHLPDSVGIDLGETPSAAPWDTPHITVPVITRPEHADAVARALATAADDVNRLIRTLA